MASELDRPAVLTRVAQRTIVESLAEGNYLVVACAEAGITRECFYYWQRLCDAKVEHAQKYADFFSAVKRASAKGERDALREVKAGNPGWQGQAWFLERRFPKRWAKKEQITVNASPADLSKMSDDEVAAIARGKGKGRA